MKGEILSIETAKKIANLENRINKAIQYILDKKLHQKVSTVPTYTMQERELLDILNGDDKE